MYLQCFPLRLVADQSGSLFSTFNQTAPLVASAAGEHVGRSPRPSLGGETTPIRPPRPSVGTDTPPGRSPRPSLGAELPDTSASNSGQFIVLGFLVFLLFQL
jgi:hypothetical protein